VRWLHLTGGVLMVVPAFWTSGQFFSAGVEADGSTGPTGAEVVEVMAALIGGPGRAGIIPFG
jgi:hypothetical protein